MTAQQTNFFMISKPTVDLPSKELLDSVSVTNYLNRSYRRISLSDIDIIKLHSDLITLCGKSVVLEGKYIYRVKALQSVSLKLEKCKRNQSGFKSCFNDLLGIRIILPRYPNTYPDYFRVVDMRAGKVNDDGYKGVHLYYMRDNFSYPIEIQIWSEHDAKFNTWSHTHAYKLGISVERMKSLRDMYDSGLILSETQFKEALRGE